MWFNASNVTQAVTSHDLAHCRMVNLTNLNYQRHRLLYLYRIDYVACDVVAPFDWLVDEYLSRRFSADLDRYYTIGYYCSTHAMLLFALCMVEYDCRCRAFDCDFFGAYVGLHYPYRYRSLMCILKNLFWHNRIKKWHFYIFIPLHRKLIEVKRTIWYGLHRTISSRWIGLLLL